VFPTQNYYITALIETKIA